MKQMMRGVSAGIVMLAMALTGAGCAGKGQTIYLDPKPKAAAAQDSDPESVRIVVEPFEDRRPDRARLGMRTHLWGGATYFNVTGDRPGEYVAQALADRLRTRGWRDRAYNVRVVSAAGANLADADIVISGQILDLTANAKSRVFSTVVTTSSKMIITARNAADQSTTSRGIEGAQHDTVFWFGEEDVQSLLADTLKDGIDRYLADTTIERRAVRSSR